MTYIEAMEVCAWALVACSFISFVFIAFFHFTPQPIYPATSMLPMKSIFTSKTVIGAGLAILAKAYGLKTGDVNSAYDLVLVLWPILLGIIADITSIISRLHQWDFDSSVFSRASFWAAITSGVCTVVAAFGVDVTGVDTVLHKILDNWPAITALAASIFSMIGSIKAKQPLDV